MTYRWLILAATAVSAAGMATAQPAQNNPRDTSRPQPQNAQVVLASAQRDADTDTGANAQPTEAQPAAQAPAKPKRAARVTTCRCGDSGQ